MRHTFRAVLLWAFVMYLGALAFVAQGQQLSQNPAKQQPQTTSSAPSEIENPPAAVVIDDRPIFYLNAPVGAYTAADRAAAIQQRILDLAKSGDVPVESVHVEERAEWSEIRSGNGLIMAVSDLDAQARGRARQQLACGNHPVLCAALSGSAHLEELAAGLALHSTSHLGVRGIFVGAVEVSPGCPHPG